MDILIRCPYGICMPHRVLKLFFRKISFLLLETDYCFCKIPNHLVQYKIAQIKNQLIRVSFFYSYGRYFSLKPSRSRCRCSTSDRRKRLAVFAFLTGCNRPSATNLLKRERENPIISLASVAVKMSFSIN